MRIAREDDADGISAVLASAYGDLMARHYDRAVMAATLPSLVRANPSLLASGTYYVQVTAENRIVACGGWTMQEPGTGRIESAIAHMRHFATHADWTRQGLGAGVFERCRQDARAAGVQTFTCFASLGSESFYRSLGFQLVERRDLRIGPAVRFPSILMTRSLQTDR